MLHYLLNGALFYVLPFHIALAAVALAVIARVVVSLCNIVLWQYCTIKCYIVLKLYYLMFHYLILDSSLLHYLILYCLLFQNLMLHCVNVALYNIVSVVYFLRTISWSTLFMVHYLMLHYFNVWPCDVALFWYWTIWCCTI